MKLTVSATELFARQKMQRRIGDKTSHLVSRCPHVHSRPGQDYGKEEGKPVAKQFRRIQLWL